MTHLTFKLALPLLFCAAPLAVDACTGISLQAQDHSQIVARSIEWGASELSTQIILVPPKEHVQTRVAEGKAMDYTTRFGYVGFSIEDKSFVVEGLNEKGLSAGLFFFPKYGRYPTYDPEKSAKTIGDMYFVGWLLGSFDSVKAVREGLKDIRLAAVMAEAGTVHFRVADRSGEQIVIEVVDGQMQIFNNPLGVLTNSPGFQWHLTNLNNYMNWQTGALKDRPFGAIALSQFGMGAGLHGLPGDISGPSRFVRAAVMQTTAPALATAQEAVLYSFKILNAFEIPIGLEMNPGEEKSPILSATQWSSATDMTNGKLYYRSQHNARIRQIDLKAIDFSRAKAQAKPLETVTQEPIEAFRF